MPLQDWDRLVMFLVGLAVSVYTGIDGYKLWQKQKYLAFAGVLVLILAALLVPIALILFAT